MEPTETAQGVDEDLDRSVESERGVELVEDDLLVELLVEEISIDGMCGVY